MFQKAIQFYFLNIADINKPTLITVGTQKNKRGTAFMKHGVHSNISTKRWHKDVTLFSDKANR